MRPALHVLEPSLLGRIVDEALTVLERTGVHIEDEHALARLATVGLAANKATNRVTFPRAVVEKALADAPSSITLHDRDGEKAAVLEGDNVHFVPASSALRVLDRKTQAGARAGHRRLRGIREARGRAQEHLLPLDRLHPQGHPAGHRRRLAPLPGARALEAPHRVRGLHVLGRAPHGRDHGHVPRGQGRPRAQADVDLHLLPQHARCAGARTPSRTSWTAPSGASPSRWCRCCSWA